ncbi:MAG: PAS domain S-box protein [Methylobacter sp.]|jgi:PAS domain S-box-containing protein
MSKQTADNKAIEMLRNKAEILLPNYSNDARKKATKMLGLSGTDISRLSSADIQKLLFEFQRYHIELELQNGELNRTHQELSASRDEYEQLYDLSPVSYLTLNKEGVIQKTNAAATHLFGHSKENLIGKKLGEFIHPLDQDNYYSFIKDSLTTPTDQTLNIKLNSFSNASAYLNCHGLNLCGCSLQFCRHNNTSTHVECRGLASYNNKNELQIHLTISDITEGKQAQETMLCLNEKLEEKIHKQTSELVESNLSLKKKVEELKYSKHQLREREAKLNSIFNASIEGIITIDTAGNIISVNAAVETIFGYRVEDLIGSSINKLMPLPLRNKTRRNLKDYLQAYMPKNIGQINEVEGIRKDGSSVPLDLSIAKFSIDKTTYFTGIVRDVSLRKHQEQLDKEHLDELAHVTRLGLMGEMASGIAHEVNQPLTAIANYTQACLNFIRGENPDLEQLDEILFKTHQQTLRAGQIIHRLRDFVKSKKIHRTTADINTLIHDAISLCNAEFRPNNIRLRLELAKNLPAVYVDNVQIEQVIINLIKNSIDALKNLPQKTQRHLAIQTQLNDDNDIEIRVKDNGPGIDEAQQQKILTPFYTTKSDGMGMGLVISRSLVEAHDGVLYFNSKPENGTTFYFTLPTGRKFNAN